MKKADRINALKIARDHDIRVIRSWWNPFQNVQWKLEQEGISLNYDQYRYLSNGNFIEIKESITDGEEAIMTLSEKGFEKLNQLMQ